MLFARAFIRVEFTILNFFITGNKEKWRSESIERPMPIFYRLRSITELFNGKYFSIDGVDVREIGQKLLQSLQVIK